MWKAEAGHKVEVKAKDAPQENDDWETGEVTPVSEKEQRWAKGKEVHVDIPLSELVQQTKQKHDSSRIGEYSSNSFARGYGGKFGVQQDPPKAQEKPKAMK